MDNKAEKVREIVGSIVPHLAGIPPEIQGAVLADLTALWAAGFTLPGKDTSSEEVKELRKQLLDQHYALVRKLVPINAVLVEESYGKIQ